MMELIMGLSLGIGSLAVILRLVDAYRERVYLNNRKGEEEQ